MKQDIAYITNPGGRKINQDSVAYAEAGGVCCLAVADGLGGYQFGEYASRLAVGYLRELFLQNPVANEENLRTHMRRTAQYISDVIRECPSMVLMRTTLVAAYLDSTQIVAGNIGDSRTYIFSGNNEIYCTQDHSLVMEMALRGELRIEDVRGHPKRNVITSALGAELPQKLDTITFDFPLCPGDGILLCSDGFWELIIEEEMLELLHHTGDAAQWLYEMDKRVGNRQFGRSDNYTCLAFRQH